MNNTKLVNVLRTFSKNEMKDFEKFISSPYFNKGRKYEPFLNELKKFYPKFDDDKLTQEYVYSRLYPGKKYNRQIVWNFTSGLLSLAEEFLIIHSLRKNKFAKSHELAREYYLRKLSVYFAKTTDEIENKLIRTGIDDDYFKFKLQLAGLKKSHKYMEDEQHLVSQHILEEGEYSVLYFLKNIASYIGDMRSSFLYFNADYGLNMPYEFLNNFNFNKFMNFIKNNNYRYSWIVELYYCRIMMILDFDNEEHFYRLKSLLLENYGKLQDEMKYNWFISLSNYCLMKLNKGIDFRRKLFEMNKLIVETGLVFPGRYFLKILFLQILRSALAIDEIQWAEKYILEYVHKLKPSYQKPMEAFSYATLYFKMGKYNKVLENLSKVKFVDARDKIDVKILYIETYYELNETEAVISLIDSTKHFLNNNSAFTELTKTNYLKSLNLLNRLVKVKLNNDTDEMEYILKEAREPRGLGIGWWLETKVDELKTQMKIKNE
jgi:hypothetical protein